MLKKLELDALKADLASVEMLLHERTEVQDPLGWMQFSERKNLLEEKINSLSAHLHDTAASVALFFGGRPVVGSRGILADFGSKVIDQFQELVAIRFAEIDGGSVGTRGPLPQRARSDLLITDVARGSVGFILEEVGSENHSLLDTPLKNIVDEVCDFIFRLSSADEERFVSFTDVVDQRLLTAFETFFSTLDSSGATLRVVENEREFSLDREEVVRAHIRTQSLQLIEREESFSGTLYILPGSRRFELHSSDVGSDVIRGSISRQCLDALLDQNGEVLPNILGQIHSVNVRAKDVLSYGSVIRTSYTLLEVRGIE